MANENLGNSQEKAARRPEIDRVKQLIKVANNISLHEDPDFPIMDPGYKDVVRSFGLQGIETVDDLFNRTEAPNYDPAKAKEALYVMATAVYETMIEEGQEELVVAGSFSVEKYLPHEFVGSDKNKPEESRFASMVVQNYIDKFGSEEKRNEISSSLEYLDYIKNSKYNQGNLLVEQAEEAYINLKKIKPNLIDKNEMDAHLKVINYVSELKREKKSKTGEEAKTTETVEREGGKRTIETPINLLSGKDDDQASDKLGTHQALYEQEGPVNNSREEISKWALRVTDNMARGSLFFAGSWQQVGPYLERQIESMFAGDKSPGAEQRKTREKEYVQAIFTCRIQEQAILHCDGDPSKYASFLPPPDVMNDYMWKEGVVSLVEGNADKKIGTIGEIRRYLRQMAYTPTGGEEIAKRLKSGGTINIYAEELAEKIKGKKTFKNEKNEDILISLDSSFEGCETEAARTAIALFIVEDYAQWSLWSCKTSVEEGGLDKVPWMKLDPEKKKEDKDAPNKSAVWTKRVIDKTGRMGWVQLWGPDFPGAVGNTCVQHPYCQFMRPVDLYRLKSSWNEEILQPLEESLCDLALRKWAYDDEGKKKGDGARNMLSPSKVGAKDFNRWNSMMSTWVGGSQADSLDNFKDWLKGAEQLKALLQLQSNVLDLGGEVAGDIFYAKVKAFMSMQKDDFLKSLSIALSSTGDDIREIQAFKSEMLGSTGVGEFGQLFESISRINLHMGTEKYYKGIAMLQTGVGDPEKALKLLSLKKRAVKAQGVFSVIGALAGQKKKR